MYIIFPCILFILVLCALLMVWRKKCIIKKICCMSVQEKLCRLNELVNPFGFEYLLSQDIFTSKKMPGREILDTAGSTTKARTCLTWYLTVNLFILIMRAAPG